jgi:glycosyltransferase involved in cell wall biosynthesis
VTERPPVLVVVPALDEEASVGHVVARLRAAGYDCLVVDDGSTDATAAVAASAGARVVRLPVHLGVGGALRCGFRYAVDHGYSQVVQCDADGQHLPEQIETLLDAQMRTNAHLVIGSRFLDGASAYRISGGRRFVMRLLSRMVRRSTGVVVHDTTSGFRCIARPLLDEFAASYPVHYLGDTFEAVIVAARAGYSVIEVPAAIAERSAGTPSARPSAALVFLARTMIATSVGLGFKIRPYDAATIAAVPTSSAPPPTAAPAGPRRSDT